MRMHAQLLEWQREQTGFTSALFKDRDALDDDESVDAALIELLGRDSAPPAPPRSDTALPRRWPPEPETQARVPRAVVPLALAPALQDFRPSEADSFFLKTCVGGQYFNQVVTALRAELGWHRVRGVGAWADQMRALRRRIVGARADAGPPDLTERQGARRFMHLLASETNRRVLASLVKPEPPSNADAVGRLGDRLEAIRLKILEVLEASPGDGS
jgi:hypothetical protein